MEPVLELDRVEKHYGPVPAVRGVSLRVERGDFTGIMGPSGCGKSTLLDLIAGITRPTAGRILFRGRDLASLTGADIARFRREELGFIFQDYNLLDTLTLGENIALALTIQGRPKGEIDEAVRSLAERLGVGGVLDRFPCQVSGGQRQRCACARALAAGPSLLLADEPTGALDSNAARGLMEALAERNGKEGATVLLVTHDALSASWCRRVLLLRDGMVAGTLERGGASRRDFFPRILNAMAALEEGERRVS